MGGQANVAAIDTAISVKRTNLQGLQSLAFPSHLMALTEIERAAIAPSRPPCRSGAGGDVGLNVFGKPEARRGCWQAAAEHVASSTAMTATRQPLPPSQPPRRTTKTIAPSAPKTDGPTDRARS
jgi:hypothetical protein